MLPHARVRIRLTPICAYVRFEDIGSRPVFGALLNSFREAVPGAQFDRSIGWQVVPIHDIGRLLGFCQARFAPKHIDVQIQNTTAGAVGQLQLVGM